MVPFPSCSPNKDEKKKERKKQWRQKEYNFICFRIPLHSFTPIHCMIKNWTLQRVGPCGPPPPAHLSQNHKVHRCHPRRCLWYWVPAPRSNLFPSLKLPSSDVAITPLHLPPSRASLICFPLLKSSETCHSVVVPRRRTDAVGCTWGQLWSGLRAPINYHPPYTRPPLRHVATCASCVPEIPWGKKCSEWHSGGSLIPT